VKPHSSSILRARILRSTSVAGAVALALATLPRAQAATLIPGAPIGGPITVRAFTTNYQDYPAVAMDATGDFVVAWEGYNPVTGNDQIYAERYAADGLPQGSVFQVDSYTSGRQEYPSVAMDAAGDFVVAWQSYGQAGSGSGEDIYAQRFASNGAPLGSNFLVNSYTSGNQEHPVVAMDATGDFVVAWQSYGQAGSGSGEDIYAQRFASNGAPLGSNFLVNSYTSGNQKSPAVAMDATGDFVVAWQSYGQASPTSGDDIYAERFASNGTPLGSNFLVNSYTSGIQEHPAVAMDATGDFVVAWQSDDQVTSTSMNDIYAERFASNGAPLGSAFLVNTYTSGGQEYPSVAMDAAGDFAVAWESYNQLGTSYDDVYAQRYSASGAALGSAFLANPATVSPPPLTLAGFDDLSVTMDATGDFVVAWQAYGYGSSHNYDYYSSIGAQRFQGETAASADVTVTGVSSESTVIPGSPFSVSFEVVNRTIPSFETSDAYLNSFIDAASDPTITVTLPAQAAAFPAEGSNWSCTSNGAASLSCTYMGRVSAGQYSPPLMVGLVAPDIPGTIVYGASVPGSSEPAFTGSVMVANAPSGGTGGGGGLGWIELVGLACLGFLRRFESKRAA